MNALRKLVILAMLVGGLGMMAGCASRGGGGSSGGSCGCAADRNCCDGCRAGRGCTCNR